MKIGVLLALGLPVVLLFWLLLLVQTGGEIGPLVALRGALRLAIVPGLGGLVLWQLSARMPWPQDRWRRFVLVHVALGMLFAGAGAVWFVLPLLSGVRGLTTELVVRSILPWQFASNLFLYGLMAGASYAVRGAWGTRDGRLSAERAERLRTQAELAALRAHINPHFLFNTLHSVTQLLRAEPARAEAALDRLAALFRYALRLDRDRVEVVSVEEEWRFTENYLWLERMRMGERLQIEATLTDDALLCAIPPFTLQPLLENAVRHGVGPKIGAGVIRVLATELDGELQLEVTDNGVGAEAAALLNSSGIGLRAVRQRLVARHGNRVTLSINGVPDGGVRIVMRLPAEPAP